MQNINRREFLKKSITSLAGVALLDNLPLQNMLLKQFAGVEKLGRICSGGEGARFDLKSKPDWDSNTVGTVYRDDVIPWFKEVSADVLDYYSVNQRWVETEGGYVYASFVQPVENRPNDGIQELPKYGDAQGMWVEITVPEADLQLEGSAGTYWMQHAIRPRVYYGQVFWVDKIAIDSDGVLKYRLTQLFGANTEYYWTPAEACRIITPEEITPLSPDVEDKKVVVNLLRQTLSCFENGREVYFCRVSTGPNLSKGWATEPGDHPIWRKLMSLHMSAGGDSGEAFDTPAIAWTSIFTPGGAAIHTAYWHNEFGFARSHGCVNCRPEDSKWVWRWTLPDVAYIPGDLTVKGMSVSSRILVVES